MNSPGGTKPRVGMPPADQRLDPDHPAGRQLDLRLVVEHEFAGIERPAQLVLELAPGPGPGVHGRLEEAKSATALVLGAVQRQVGAPHQLVGVGTVIGMDGNADAGGDVDPLPIDGERCRNRLDQPLGQNGDAAGLRHVGLQDGEFVAAEPGQRVADAHDPGKPLCHRRS